MCLEEKRKQRKKVKARKRSQNCFFLAFSCTEMKEKVERLPVSKAQSILRLELEKRRMLSEARETTLSSQVFFIEVYQYVQIQ